MKKSINKFLGKFNYRISKVNKPVKPALNTDDMVSETVSNKVLLNLGSGNWSHNGWINLDYPSEWYANAQKSHKIIPYDIRNDNIPFNNNSVGAIYCSHVIEHIENIHIQKMFDECYRVLNMGGVLRIACPDAEFLYQVSKFDSDYWSWRFNYNFFDGFYEKGLEPRNVDFLVREIASPKLLYHKHSINDVDYEEEFKTMDMYDFFEFMTNDLSFRTEYVGHHINYFTFGKAKQMLEKAGFNIVIRSKWSASVLEEMKNMSKFDATYPNMSLYVEAIKY